MEPRLIVAYSLMLLMALAAAALIGYRVYNAGPRSRERRRRRDDAGFARRAAERANKPDE